MFCGQLDFIFIFYTQGKKSKVPDRHGTVDSLSLVTQGLKIEDY